MAYPCNFNVSSHIVAAPFSPVKLKVQQSPVLQLLRFINQAHVHSWLLSLSKGSISCIKQVKVIKNQGPHNVDYSDVTSLALLLPPEVSTVVRLSGSNLSPVTTKSQMWAASNSNISKLVLTFTNKQLGVIWAVFCYGFKTCQSIFDLHNGQEYIFPHQSVMYPWHWTQSFLLKEGGPGSMDFPL